jgi:type III pantothenate kinase
MNLVIDIGNTHVKLAVFNNNSIIEKRIGKVESFEEDISVLLKKYPLIKKGIVSSVGKFNKGNLKFISRELDIYLLDVETKHPFKNAYKTPNTLGVDRIALIAASVKNYSYTNVLIIDAGTCITYDFINKENLYLGGAISLGINMRYKSLNNLTQNLPLLDKQEPKNLIGNSTKESIHSGVINGVLIEIDGIIHQYKKKYKDLTVILTGGDANFLSKRLKSSIFANSNFLLEGLNFLLEFNSN